MTEYALYVESGPRRRKTMVHVIDLLGCIARGPTTEAALDATPEAIRTYLRFLHAHGEAVHPEEPFTTAVAQHVTEGSWTGNGDPAPGFAPDFRPLSVEEQKLYLRRLAWLQAGTLRLIGGLSTEQLLAEPQDGGRSIYRIGEHMAGAHYSYLMTPVGKVKGLSADLRAIEHGPEALPGALTHLWQAVDARLQAMTDSERAEMVQHGQVTWTARRALRRMLEHNWEHLLEIAARLGNEPG